MCFASKLQRYREQGLPWLALCLQRVPERIKGNKLLLTLTFLSCIGMIENNAYVENERLREPMKELPLTQKMMQELQLQSRFSLPRRSGFIVWRLHEVIPYRMPGPDRKPAPKKPRVEEQEEEEKPLEEALVEVDPGEGPSSWQHLGPSDGLPKSCP